MKDSTTRRGPFLQSRINRINFSSRCTWMHAAVLHVFLCLHVFLIVLSHRTGNVLNHSAMLIGLHSVHRKRQYKLQQQHGAARCSGPRLVRPVKPAEGWIQTLSPVSLSQPSSAGGQVTSGFSRRTRPRQPDVRGITWTWHCDTGTGRKAPGPQ